MAASTAYDVLGISPTSSHDEIQSAYRALARILHPDSGGDRHAFEVLQEAYEKIETPQRRRAYDAALADTPKPPTSSPRPAAERTNTTQRPSSRSTTPVGCLGWAFLDLFSFGWALIALPVIALWALTKNYPVAGAITSAGVLVVLIAILLWHRRSKTS